MLNSKHGAVIDLGSNTFHLLIFEKQDSSPFFKEVYRERQLVYLAEAGVSRISDAAFDRGVKALVHFKALCDQYNVDQIKAIGTSALRNADNAQSFVQSVLIESDISINIIEGELEAYYIYKGQSLLDIEFKSTYLIVDIGGGSVEFILVDNEGIISKASYTMGISHLRNTFRTHDPATPEELNSIFSHFDDLLSGFSTVIQDYKPSIIIGASGPFEILESIINGLISQQAVGFDRSVVLPYIEKVLSANLSERQAFDGMPSSRADLSKESFIIIQYCLQRFLSLDKIMVSPYAMKEGIIAEWLNLE